ncbi:MAG: MFS transporter [Chloroflexota bacterium]
MSSVPLWRRAVYADGALGGVYAVLIGSPVLTGLILWAGGGPLELGLLSALTTGGSILVLGVPRLQRRSGSHKPLTRVAWTAGWALWLPLALYLAVLPFSSLPSGPMVISLLLATAFVSAALVGTGNVAWSTWVAHLLPSANRGSFLAQQTRWLSLAGLFALPAVGYVLDETKLAHRDALGFAAVLAAPGLCAAAGWRLLGEVPAGRVESDSARVQRARGFDEVSVQELVRYTVLWQVSLYLAAPFLQAYALGRLGLSFSTIMYLQILALILPVLTLGWWGRIIDRRGLRAPLAVCSIGRAPVPLFFLMATGDAWWPVIGAYLLSVLDAGLTIANGTALANVAEGSSGSAGVAHLTVLTSVAASVTPVVAGFLLSQFPSAPIDLLAVLFVLSALGRATSGALLLRIKRPATSVSTKVHPPAGSNSSG